MAEAIVSAAVLQLKELAAEEVSRLTGVDKEIQNLTSNFWAIQAVLHDAERRQVKDASVQNWLHDLKEVSYDVGDVLDKWKTALLRSKTRQQLKNDHKVRSFLQSPHFWVNQLASRHNIALKIRELTQRLDSISERKERFHFIHERINQEERTRTTSIIDVAEVCGREQEIISVKNMLLAYGSSSSSSSTQEEEALRVISIVGMGGIGKTTLAQRVYNEPEIMSHFDKKIWICVSDSFDEAMIAKEILESCRGLRPDVDGMDNILQEICKHISGKKVLLVLDDVWTEEFGKWEQLINTIKCASPGSRILVTTRNEKVGMSFGSIRSDVYSLGILNKEDSWALFTQIAFNGRTVEEAEMLEAVCWKILAKCEGLPLAIKIISSHLRFKTTKEEWEHVLNSETWEIKDANRGIFGPLLFSYYELPSVSKRCFSYCAVFPKDYKFNKDELIKLWMAQGFFGETNGMEHVASECFNDLAVRCFFQDFERDDDWRKYRFKMHDIVHDFAMFLSEGECWLVDAKDMKYLSKKPVGKHIRHVFCRPYGFETFQFLNNTDGCKKWRSFYAEKGYTIALALDWRKLSYLRTLKLKELELEVLPDSIGKLELLRYLDLSDNEFLKTLPESLGNLCNLQILNLRGCLNLERLPQRIGELAELSYLGIEITWRLKCMPKGIKRLINLKELDKFVVSGRVKDAGFAELGSLLTIKMKRIVIHISKENRDASECTKAKLQDKTELGGLYLQFVQEAADESSRLTNEKEEQVLEALRPPPCLEWLLISGYSGFRVPDWIAPLNNLKFLELDNCKELEQLPPLGKLPGLGVLHLYWLPKVRKVGAEFLGITLQQPEMQHFVAFPSLTRLCIECNSMWEEWEWGEGEHPILTIMPRLNTLAISQCPKLKVIPRQLLEKATLEFVDIHECPNLQVDRDTIGHRPR